MSRPARRYPLQPLLDCMGLSLQDAAVRLGISGRTRNKLRDEGLIEAQADRYAVRAGLLPCEVWPEILDHNLSDATEAEQRTRDLQRAADRRHKARRREDPAYRARQSDYLREYRSSDRAKAAARQYRKAHYQANRERELDRQRVYDATVRAERRRRAA